MTATRYAIVLITIAAASLTAFAAPDDGNDLSLAVSNLDTLHRVTETPHEMADSTVMFCRLVFNPNIHEGARVPAYCHVYVNAAAKGPMADGKGQYPAGAVIVKSKLQSKTDAKAELFTVMRKMRDGYDDKHGNWEYSVLDGKTARVLAQGRIESCFACHEQFASTDYVTRAYLAGK